MIQKVPILFSQPSLQREVGKVQIWMEKLVVREVVVAAVVDCQTMVQVVQVTHHLPLHHKETMAVEQLNAVAQVGLLVEVVVQEQLEVIVLDINGVRRVV
jgi:hypothetical protein